MLSNKVKGYFSIFAGFCLHFIIGSLYTWAVTNSYFATYLRTNGNPSLKLNDSFFFMPTIIFVQYCSMTIGVQFGDAVGVRLSTLVSAGSMIVSYVLLIYLTNYYVVMIIMFAYGLGDGLGHLTVIKNAWRYFPNNKGLINGIILGGLGLSAAMLNPIADLIINPQGVSPLKDGFYPEEIGKRIESFFWFLVILFSVLGAFAIAFSFPYDEMQIDSDKDAAKMIENKVDLLHNEAEQGVEAIPKQSSTNETVSYAYCTKANLHLSIFCFGTPFFCFLLTNTNRAFGSLHQLDQRTLQVMSFVFGFLNGSMRFLWGYLLDILGFRILMLVICILELSVSVSIYFIADNAVIYFIENMLIASCLSGGLTLLTPTFNKVFGSKLGATMYGLGAVFIGLASILGPVLSKFIIKSIEDYLIIYLCGSSFVMMSFITLIFFKEEPFAYGKLCVITEDEALPNPNSSSHRLIPTSDSSSSDIDSKQNDNKVKNSNNNAEP